jgi:hypothetical protein
MNSNKNCNCRSDGGHYYSLDKSTWNNNDRLGVLMIILLASIVCLLSYTIYCWKKGYPIKNGLLYSGIAIGILSVIMFYKPILLLYAPSAILSNSIRTPEFLDRKVYFPNHILFEEKESFTKLKKEVSDMLSNTQNGDSLTLTKNTYSGENDYIGSDTRIENGKTLGWRILNIKIGDEYTSIAKQHFPHLVSILDEIPEVRSCVVSVIQPGIRIPIHVGYYKGILRYMIATHVPKDRNNVFLCVNGKKYKWTEGVGVLWDDTYLHKVYNNTNESRVVIYMDVIRPLTSTFANILNYWILDQATGSSIVKKEIQDTEVQVKI